MTGPTELLGETERPLRPAEVAALFGVTTTTVTRWAQSGRLPTIRTPGGHHRFVASAVRKQLAAERAGGG